MPIHWIALSLLTIRMLSQTIRLRSGVQGTTLTTAANWGVAVCLAWVASVSSMAFWFSENQFAQDQMWYWVAVLSLIPPIAVLGARRPGSDAWNFFVLVPLVFVLGWPALTVWTGHGPEALRVEAPVLIGFVLVLVMGCGNYISTRLAIPALLYALGVTLVLAPCSTLSTTAGLSTETFRVLGTLAMLQSTFWGGWVLRSDDEASPAGPELVWHDFREMFGIVWTKRALDRINEEFAEREHWPARLGPLGLEWTTPPDPLTQQQTEERLIYALKWLLRRFVSPDWIDERLTSDEPGEE